MFSWGRKQIFTFSVVVISSIKWQEMWIFIFGGSQALIILYCLLHRCITNVWNETIIKCTELTINVG